MASSSVSSRVDFLRKAERLKDTLRSAYTTHGRTESVADHTWRLTLLAITFADKLPDIDLLKFRTEFASLWDEYEDGSSPEARTAKALDKLETILQHNQGSNPEDFDYDFNLEYGKAHTNKVPIAAQVRELLDVETKAKAGKMKRTNGTFGAKE